MYNQKRCIVFPRSTEAVELIETEENDSRVDADVIDLSYDQYGKLKLFGFFKYPKESQLRITANSFVKIEPSDIQLLINSALISRKEIRDKRLLKIIDRFVEKAKRSAKENLPVWLST